MDCSVTLLVAVPLILLTNVRVLWLSDNNIPCLEKDIFVSLTELEVLHISECELSTIDLGAFNGLTELRELALSINKINEIIPGSFENASKLAFLSLQSNKLKHVDSAMFSGLVNLNVLNLQDNQLQYLHPDTFSGLPNLQKLYLGENWGLEVPTDRNFINSPFLSHLDISDCGASSVSVETFENVSALELLSLSQNDLNTVDINILRAMPKLSTLYMEHNPLHCDCQLQEVWRWCKDRNIQTVHRRWVPQCDTPSEVNAMGWGVLEKGECLEGHIQFYGDYNSTRYSYTEIDLKGFKDYNLEFFTQYQVPIYAVPFIFGTIGNVILLIIIIHNKDMRTIPNMYILNLAISNIIYLTVFSSEACANGVCEDWLNGDFMCMFLPFCRRLSVGLSAYFVALLSIQRYRVTVNPFHVRVSSQPTWRVTVATICGVWIVAALFAVPSSIAKYMCEGLQFFKSINYYQHLVIFELLVTCVLPLCVIAFSYVMTACHLVESSRSISEGTENPQLKARRNVAKIVVGLTVVFVISSVPYHAFWTYINYVVKEEVVLERVLDLLDGSYYKLRYSYLIATFFLSINSCLNPVALFCTSSPFRHNLKRYLTCFCKTSSPPTDLELRRRN